MSIIFRHIQLFITTYLCLLFSVYPIFLLMFDGFLYIPNSDIMMAQNRNCLHNSYQSLQINQLLHVNIVFHKQLDQHHYKTIILLYNNEFPIRYISAIIHGMIDIGLLQLLYRACKSLYSYILYIASKCVYT